MLLIHLVVVVVVVVVVVGYEEGKRVIFACMAASSNPTPSALRGAWALLCEVWRARSVGECSLLICGSVWECVSA